MALSVGRIVGLIELRDQFTGALRNAAAEVDRAAPKVQALQKRFEDLGSNLRGAGFALTAGITAPIAGIGALALKSSIDFQGAMNRLEASSTGTAEQIAGDMGRMRAAAIEWGAKTQFSSTQAADALTELQKGGLSANQAIAALPSTLQLATAGQMELAEAATLSANTMATFGLSAGDMSKANDALAKAAALSTIDVRDLAESFKYVGPVARQSGVSLEFTAAAMAAMGESGIKGSMGGTALRGVLTTLMTPTAKQAALMEQLGLSTAFADGKMKSLPEILAMIEAHIKRTGNAGQTGAELMELFGDRAGPGMLALLNKGSEGLATLEGKLHDVGYAGRVQEAMMKGLPGAMERMSGAVSTAATSLGEVLAPAATVVAGAIEKLAGFITNIVVPAFSALPGPVKVYMGLLVALAAAIGPLLLVMGGLSTALGAMIPLLTTVGILKLKVGAAATTAAAGTTAMTAASASLNLTLLTTIARFTAIGGAVALVIASLGEIKKGFDALMIGGDAFWELMRKNRARTKALFGFGPEDTTGAPKAGANTKPDVNLKAPTFTIPGLDKTFEQGAGGLAASLKLVNDELKNFMQHPAKVKDLTEAIKTGAFTTEQLSKAAGISEMAVKKFADGLKDTRAAAKDTEKSLDDLRNAAQALTDRALDKIITYAKTGKNEIELLGKTNIQSVQHFGQLRDAMVATTKTGLTDHMKDLRESAQGVRHQLMLELPVVNAARSSQINFSQSLIASAQAGEAFASKAVVTTGAIDKLTKSFSSGSEAAQQYGQKLAQVIVGALQGGGDVTKALGATLGGDLGVKLGGMLGAKLAKGIGGALGGMVGGMASSFIGPLGSILGAWAGEKIGGLFGGNKVKKLIEDSFGSYDALREKMNALGDEGDRMWVKLTQQTGKGDIASATKQIEAMEAALARVGTTADKAAEAQKKVAAESVARLTKAHDAATAQVKALDDQLASLYKSIENEAPEEVMGVIESQARARISALEKERDAAQRHVESIQQQLIESTNRVADALDKLPKQLEILVTPRFERFEGGEYPEPEGYARGGLVGRGMFRSRGTDTVPAMLTPGEIVLNAAQQDNVAAALQSDPFASAQVASRPVHIHMYQDGRKTAEATIPHLADIINVSVA